VTSLQAEDLRACALDLFSVLKASTISPISDCSICFHHRFARGRLPHILPNSDVHLCDLFVKLELVDLLRPGIIGARGVFRHWRICLFATGDVL